MENKSKELIIAIKAALEAGKILEKYFETEVLKEYKEDTTIVTLADKESEEVIKKIILDAFPEHSILGEETGHTDNNSEFTWHIDPLDGTRNFANCIPFFGVSIALVNNNELTVGVVYNPITNSLFYAEKNKGSFLNDRRIFVSKDDASHSMVTVDPGKKEEEKQLRRELYKTLPARFRSVRDLGSTAVHLAYVARGSLEANIQLGLQTYDFAAGALLVLEAGGKITKHDGSPWFFPDNKFIASNGIFHEALVDEIKNQKLKLSIN
jgi:myo-inositol-1(or 4)-monophosphatase